MLRKKISSLLLIICLSFNVIAQKSPFKIIKGSKLPETSFVDYIKPIKFKNKVYLTYHRTDFTEPIFYSLRPSEYSTTDHALDSRRFALQEFDGKKFKIISPPYNSRKKDIVYKGEAIVFQDKLILPFYDQTTTKEYSILYSYDGLKLSKLNVPKNVHGFRNFLGTFSGSLYMLCDVLENPDDYVTHPKICKYSNGKFKILKSFKPPYLSSSIFTEKSAFAITAHKNIAFFNGSKFKEINLKEEGLVALNFIGSVGNSAYLKVYDKKHKYFLLKLLPSGKFKKISLPKNIEYINSKGSLIDEGKYLVIGADTYYDSNYKKERKTFLINAKGKFKELKGKGGSSISFDTDSAFSDDPLVLHKEKLLYSTKKEGLVIIKDYNSGSPKLYPAKHPKLKFTSPFIYKGYIYGSLYKNVNLTTKRSYSTDLSRLVRVSN